MTRAKFDTDGKDVVSIPKTREYIESLTGLRGIAALSVFMFHYGALHPGIRLDLSIPVFGYVLQTPIGLGFIGVDLFFVLSGFLLSLPFATVCLRRETQPSISRYLKRRMLRVFPAYYFQWAVIMLFGAWFVTWKPLGVESVLAHFVMFFNIGTHPVTPVVGIWWSLPVELSFYLLLPVFALLMRPGRWVVLLFVCLLLSVFYRIWAASHFSEATTAVRFLTASQIPGSLPLFLFGASAALLVKWMQLNNIRPPAPQMATLLFLVGVILSMLWLWKIVLPYGDIYWDGHWSMIFGPMVQGISMSMMILGLYWGSRAGTFLCSNKPIYFVGVVSYSLYLWHFVVMQQIQLLGGNAYAELPGLIKFVLCTLITMAIATLSYFLIERPFFRLRDRKSTQGLWGKT